MDSYSVYCQWCIDHNRVPPTREWWDKACAKPKTQRRILCDVIADIETEQREGWTYADTI